MANIQYIGARYVPKFYENPDDQSNNWKAGVAYEPLTVVTYHDESYTSKRSVPGTIGDPASNSAYWIITAGYNAAITALQNEVGLLDSEMNGINGVIENGAEVFAVSEIIKPNFITTLSGDSDYVALQGVAYNPLLDVYVACILCDTDRFKCAIIEIANDFVTVNKRAYYTNAELGHGNSICYNSDNNHYYVAGGNDRDTPLINKLVEIDPSDLSIVSQHIIDISPVSHEYEIGKVAYNYNDKIYYCFSNYEYFKIDSNFNVLERGPLNVRHLMGFTSGLYCGDTRLENVIYANDKLYGLLYNYTAGSYAQILVFDDDINIIMSYELNYYSTSREPEALAFNNGHLYLFTNRLYSVNKLSFQREKHFNAGAHFFGSSLTLENGTDLDDVLNEGKIYIRAATAATLLNTPFANHSFALDVRHMGMYIYQTVTLNTDDSNYPYLTATRLRHYERPWSDWKYEHNAAVVGRTIDVPHYVIAGVISSGAKELMFTLPMPAVSLASETLTFTFNELQLAVRNDSGYVPDDIEAQEIHLANVNVAGQVLADGTIRIKIHKTDDSVFSTATNNSVVAVQIYKLQFTVS